ncbi:bifunctional diguanylate cyclase/phosphodiesterase [Actinoplanes sp. NEAU-A12]|uniref:Bifunctional diguanylate cyclase/phosphodiesterase n=1 Tax=Actinoplanes sandaracinus TaxID=3045177 RepID=A0ABT6WUT3_9ACTN|nr:bifunctional diguanylate cyclase/phosphodiesterase [Actinoplanes sandaracinus]MDI6103511.1 bifunctional diguanylate cyclase/phosphodiesterase [Actinoplanes sandaracinus]
MHVQSAFRPARRRPDPALVAALGLITFVMGWFVTGLWHVWGQPMLPWLAIPALSALTTYECWRTSCCAGLDADTRRFWGRLGLACVILVPGALSTMYDALSGPVPSQLISVRTQILFGCALALVLTALLRLPSWRRTSGDWLRFGLDTGITMIIAGTLVWHYSLSRIDFSSSPTATPPSVIVTVIVAAVSLVTFVKVAFSGAGRLDRGSLYLLSAGVAMAAAAGTIAPFILDRPYLSTGMVAFPVAEIATIVAARRQRLRRDAPPPARPVARRFSLVPYLSVGLLYVAVLRFVAPAGGEVLLLALAATAVTVLVVLRQLTTLRDNARLLDTVDASLTQLKAYQKQLDHQITHDELTGIGNRSAYADEISARLAAGEPFVVALLDLDDFKTVNDRYGHSTGDALLRTISRRLHDRLRPEDTVARLGGDEFTLLLPGLSTAETDGLLRELLTVVQAPVLEGDLEMVPRISVGLTASRPDDTAGELLRRADVAMYAAKTAGGGRWTWFDPIMDQLAADDARLAADLRQAIARDELFLLYQPIVELPHGGLAGVEALVRWRHPKHGLISPGVFIPLAERNGYIVEVGRWVVEQAVQQAARWERELGPDAPAKVSVNVSARQLGEPGFPAEMAAVLSAAGLDPARLVVEVTETAVLGTGVALEVVRALAAQGLSIALDDFGTGQSSLSLLVHCPVSWLKVDKSFVDGVTTDSPQAVIVDSLIGITEGLRMQAVAEGVETAEQAERLHQAGYRFAQGFHFARPMSEADIELLATVREPRRSPADLGSVSRTPSSR